MSIMKSSGARRTPNQKTGVHNGSAVDTPDGGSTQREEDFELGKVTFRSPDKLPFDIRPEMILKEVSKRIKVPRKEGYGSFKTTLKSEASCEILVYYFWYLYAKQYLPDQKKLANGLLNVLAEKFVHLFWSLQSSADKDFFLEYFSFVMGCGACLAFESSFPASIRTEFTEQFKDNLFVNARLSFSGEDVTPEVMHTKRAALALADGGGMGARGQGENEEAVDSQELWTEEELAAALKTIPGYIENKKQRMKREKFDGRHTSPLINHYINKISEGVRWRPLKLNRTVNDPDCPYGGEDTFMRTPSRINHQEDVYEAWTKARAESKHAMKLNRFMTLHDVAKLDDTKTMLMNSGAKLISQFVEDQMAPGASDRSRSTF